MHTSEAFRTRLTFDFANAMKATTGSSFVHQQWFMPIHVMVDLFAVAADSIRRTPTLFVSNSPSEALLSSLMNPGWNEKFHIGQDVIKCVANRSSIVFRYHVGRQTLYTRFMYTRYRGAANNNWDAIDHLPDEEMVEVCCMFRGNLLPTFEVGKAWPVSHLRHEIAMTLGDDVPKEYNMVVIDATGVREKKVRVLTNSSCRLPEIIAPFRGFLIHKVLLTVATKQYKTGVCFGAHGWTPYCFVWKKRRFVLVYSWL
jgi:hypothetical protein